MDLNDALGTFVAEARGLLEAMEWALMLLEKQPGDSEAIHAVFRAAHTIKGAAGLFGLDDIVAFTHELETALVDVREGRLALHDGFVSLLLQCGDHIGALIDRIGDADARAALAPAGTALAQQVGRLAGRPTGGTDRVDAAAGTAPNAHGAPPPAEPAAWHLSLRFAPGVLREGFDPAPFIHHLRTLGRIVQIQTVDSALPPLDALDPECCWLGFEIRLASSARQDEIEAVFEFMGEDCQLRILPPEDPISPLSPLSPASPNGPQEAPPRPAPAAVDGRAYAAQRQTAESRLIRVNADKLDALIDLVGELVVASAGVDAMAQRHRDRPLREAVSTMARLTEGVRDGAMRLRLVEIGETFSRFRRVVRDVSKELGKAIELELSGAETELDKSLVGQIGDPLLHLVRNAIDHGIEPAQLRLARGKPPEGRLALRARHEAGAVLIEVADDGGGLDRERILAKAVQQGLVEDGATLSDPQVWNLIFEPGFSTAEQVSAISGRGVGMDVVRRSVEALRGHIEIDSVAGQGTTFRIRLPLTLAIVDGFLMGVAEGHYVVPLDAVLECVKLDAGLVARDCIDLRGEVLPLLRLRRQFGLQGPPPRRENVVVVQLGTRKAGLVVDQLKGEFQAVIKPLGPLMDGLPGISGTTILGSGDVALMLDIAALIHRASSQAGGRAVAAPPPHSTCAPALTCAITSALLH